MSSANLAEKSQGEKTLKLFTENALQSMQKNPIE